MQIRQRFIFNGILLSECVQVYPRRASLAMLQLENNFSPVRGVGDGRFNVGLQMKHIQMPNKRRFPLIFVASCLAAPRVAVRYWQVFLSESLYKSAGKTLFSRKLESGGIS